MEEAAKRISKIRSIKLVILVAFFTGIFIIVLFLSNHTIETETLKYSWGYLNLWQTLLCVFGWLFLFGLSKGIIAVYCERTLERECDPELYYYLTLGVNQKISERLKGIIELHTWTEGGSFEGAKRQAEKYFRDKNGFVFITAVECFCKSCYFTSDLDGLIRINSLVCEREKDYKFLYKKKFIILKKFIAVLSETLKENYFKAGELVKELSSLLPKLSRQKKKRKKTYAERHFFVAEILRGLGEKNKATANYLEVIKYGNKLIYAQKAKEILQDK